MTAEQKREARYRKLCSRCKSVPAVRRNVMGSPMWLHDSTVECKAAAEREKDFQSDKKEASDGQSDDQAQVRQPNL
jgi:hypothetical protein